MKCTVVHLNKSDYDVRIDRTTKWGNPFEIGRDGTRKEVIAKFKEWIKTQPELLNSLHELRGERLGCWCYPLPCHGDVLAYLVNSRFSKANLFNDRIDHLSI